MKMESYKELENEISKKGYYRMKHKIKRLNQKEENLKIINEYKKNQKKGLLDLLPKWTSIVVWIGILIYLLSMGVLKAQSLYPSSQIEIVGYRIVMSEKYGCWSELEIINNDRYQGVRREIIIDKITKYELYGMSSGESPLLEIHNNNGSISYYHIVKLPSDTSW
jgi:hypothetical protein